MKIKTLEQLEIPSEKNAIFVSPKYSSWREMLDYNLATGSDSQDKSTARSQLLNIARVYTSQLLPGFYNQPKTANIIVTGHQPIWHHPTKPIWTMPLCSRKMPGRVEISGLVSGSMPWLPLCPACTSTRESVPMEEPSWSLPTICGGPSGWQA